MPRLVRSVCPYDCPDACGMLVGGARGGARVWVVDTYRTPTAALADRLVLTRPGSDGALVCTPDGWLFALPALR